MLTQYAFAQQSPEDCGPNQVFQLGVCQDIDESSITWNKSTYKICDTGIITISAPEENTRYSIQVFFIQVSSDSDPVGVEVVMIETGSDTGVFIGTLQLCEPKLYVVEGDRVFATYGNITVEALIESTTSITVSTDKSTYDHSSTIFVNGKVTNPDSGTPVTLTVISPTNHIVSTDQLSIDTFANFNTRLSTIGNLWANDGTYAIRVQYGSGYVNDIVLVELIGSGSTTKLLSSNPRLVDDFGNTLHSLSVGQQVHITIDLENQNNFVQSFVFYYKIRETVDNDWIMDLLNPNQSLSSAMSWTPDRAGTYTIDITIFEDMDRQNVLAPTITIHQVVDDPGGKILTSPNTVSIPSGPSVLGWAKAVAGFWCGDEMDDAFFIVAVQHMINNDVIIVPATASGGSGAQEIPNWVKNNACWWFQGLITDSDFASGLQYLIGQEIIRL